MFFILGYKYRMASLDGNWDKIVPCVSHSAINKPYWAPAGSGGGGGGSAELEISTILFGPGEFNLGTLDVTNPGTLAINNSSTPAINDIVFTTNSDVLDTPSNFIEINSPDANTSLQLFAQNNGNNALISNQASLTLGAESTISIQASSISVFAPTSISSLTVSTINGVVPGGGSVGPNLGVSSISIAPLGYVYLETGAGDTQGTVSWNTSIDGAESFQAYWRNGQVGDVLVSNKSLAFVALSTNSVIGTAPLDCLAINLKASAGSPASGVIGDNGAGQMYLTGVSTINGGAYPPASSLYPFISSISPGGGGVQTQYFCSTNSEAQILTTFDTQVGHNYQLNLPFFVSSFTTPTYGDAILIGSVGAGATDLIYTLPLIQGATWNVPLVFKNTIADAQVSVLIGTNTTFPIEVNLGSSAGAELIDLGPSAP